MFTIRSLNRWQAFGSHLVISVLVFLILLGIIIFYWYPGLFINMGGWQGIRIVAGVDLVLGPVLTLIVFNPKKKYVVWDLTAIGILQASCLAIGVWTVERERPLAQVLAHDGVHIASKTDFKSRGITWDVLNQFPGKYPKVVLLDLPADRSEANNWAMTSILKTGIPIKLQTEKYMLADQSNKDDYNTRLNYFAYNKQDDCHWIEVFSGHFKGKGCFNISTGISQLGDVE